MNPSEVLLTAEWRDLAMLNYVVDPALLHRFVPAGTELELWNGHAFLSLVGFRFLNARVLGISFPFHSNFEEVNLRLYVQRQDGRLIKRGVVFIREIVPRWAIAALARTLYNESYVSLPMSHQVSAVDENIKVMYAWRSDNRWNRMSLAVKRHPVLPGPSSEERFITEHYWGYARQQDGSSVEYQVAHPAWRVWSALDAQFEGDVEQLYGNDLAAVLKQKPASAFLAEGSEVTVYKSRRL